MDMRSNEELEVAGTAGEVVAQIELARRYISEGSQEAATEWLKRAAGSGSAEEKYRLGWQLFGPPLVEGVMPQAAALAVSAANDGNGDAAYLTAKLAAAGHAMPQNWTTALVYLQRAAELGCKPAQDELLQLSNDPDLASAAAEGQMPPPDHWRRLRSSMDLARWLAVPRPRVVNINPRIAVAENFVSPEHCDWLMELARANLSSAQSAARRTMERPRRGIGSNGEVFLPTRDCNFATIFLQQRIAAIAQLRFPGLELPAILHYAVGQDYPPHTDYLDPTSPALANEIARGGQRAVTFLIYLNDTYEGGETDFPAIPWRHKGKKGDALFWWNATPTGQPDPKTVHSGLPPTSGEKWVLSQWIRLRVAPPQPPA